MKKLIFFFLISIIIASCGSDNKNAFTNDFDQLADWGHPSPMLKKGNAHSGVYYCGLDSTNDFSIAFSKNLKDLPIQNISKITLSGWVRAKSLPSRAALIVTIDSAGGPVKYMGIGLRDVEIIANEWTEVKETFEDIPSGLYPDFFLKVYLYNPGKENIDIDDIRFEIE